MKKNSAKSGTSKGIDQYQIGQRVKYLRGLRNLSQTELAKKAKLSQSTVAQVESERLDPSINTLKALAKALDISMAVFFAGDDIHVFDMNKLSRKYKKAEDLNPTLYKATGEVIRWAKKIGYI